ncbi:hypothetical protein FACS1894218_6080 [Bacilli bacterium]|nr:hypothetical protein FACS1894218_6080 [Bacilli bacterium]
MQNPGVDHILKHELPSLKKIYHKKVIANIAATEISGYAEIIKKLNNQAIIGIYEVNVSCPNVNKGALKFDSDPIALTKLIKTIKPIAKKPLYIKLSPQVTNIALMATTAEKAGADGLVLINTMPGLRIDLNTQQPIMANKIGGMSGPAIKSIALRAVYLCHKVVNIPIIGVGGISNADDVIEMMLAGATAVEIGSECLINPHVCLEIINDLPKQMNKYHINSLTEIIGKANRG